MITKNSDMMSRWILTCGVGFVLKCKKWGMKWDKIGKKEKKWQINLVNDELYNVNSTVQGDCVPGLSIQVT